MARGWRVLFEQGYPIKSLAFLGAMVVLMAVWTWAVAFAVPAEREVIAHGAHAMAHVTTTKIPRRQKPTEYYADLTWQDAQGHPRSYDSLPIGAGAYSAIGSAATTEILYVDDERPVVVADLANRARQQSNAWVGLVIFGIVTLLAAYHLRRRVREWRTEQAARTAPPPW
jgi:hypothetical protein